MNERILLLSLFLLICVFYFLWLKDDLSPSNKSYDLSPSNNSYDLSPSNKRYLSPSILSNWVEWHQNPKAPFRQMKNSTVNLLKTRLFSAKKTEKNLFERIDQFNCPSATNMTRGNHPHVAQDHFFWAWHSGDCNGIKDKKWIPSNGRQLGVSLCNEVTRLRRFNSDSHQRQGI
jgi:hypothetical protein